MTDTLDHRGGDDVLDEGWSPPEKPWGVEHTGVTASERQRGESLDERLFETRTTGDGVIQRAGGGPWGPACQSTAPLVIPALTWR
ncbi:hypothetical protein ACL07V_33385 [Streptomyces sp. MB22_4]|uniref:hypothetical protein n=1 Tax=Streptomyces sp. MB22_4 TaxID=3383120 RepID=UPI0039A0B0E3